MGPLAALDSVFSKFATFRGRATRAEYWWFTLMYIVILIAAIAADIAFLDPELTPSLNPLTYFTFLWMVICIIPGFALTVRRLHDTGRSGLMIFVQIVPVIGGIWFFILMVLPSDHGQNNYGEPPRTPRGFSGPKDVGGVTAYGSPIRSGPAQRNPYAGYALLEEARRETTPEMLEARRESVQDYYRNRVLKKAS